MEYQVLLNFTDPGGPWAVLMVQMRHIARIGSVLLVTGSALTTNNVYMLQQYVIDAMHLTVYQVKR